MSSYLCDCGAGRGGHGGHCAIFKCGTCGAQASISPPEGETYCAECCPDHEYEYEPGEGRRCKTCFAEPPLDWYETI